MKKLFELWLKYLNIDISDFKNNYLRINKKNNSGYIEKWLIENKEIVFYNDDIKDFFDNPEIYNFYDQEIFLHIEENNLKTIENDNYILKKIDLKYKKSFEKFQSELTSKDKDTGFVELEHLAIFAAFDNEKIVSASSIINYGPFKDIGVITHPDYRQKNLGTGVVRMATKWCFDNNEIPLYRCQVKNTGSLKIAEKIGYKKYIKIDAYKK